MFDIIKTDHVFIHSREHCVLCLDVHKYSKYKTALMPNRFTMLCAKYVSHKNLTIGTTNRTTKAIPNKY